MGQIMAAVYLVGALYLTVRAIYNPSQRTWYMIALAIWAGAYLAIN